MSLKQRSTGQKPQDQPESVDTKKTSTKAEDAGSYSGAVFIYLMALTPAVTAALILSLLPRILGPVGGKVVEKALASAFKGGLPGAFAALLQIVLLMWLRTVTNYQYKHGGTMMEAIGKLWAEGGVKRFYEGWFVAAAQVQG